jgi:hypothetical protein
VTTLRVAEKFSVAAHQAGAAKHFIELVVEPSAAVQASPGYPRLVAALYATTLPESERTPAAAGCVEELTAPEEGDKAASGRPRHTRPPMGGG